mgnify:CR=1 FL=1
MSFIPPHESHTQAPSACGGCPDNNTTAIRQADERFRLVVEAAPYGLLMVNPAGIITMINPQCESIFGFTQEELIGQSLAMLLPLRCREAHDRHLLAFFANPVRKQMGGLRDLPGLRKDGTEVPVEIGLTLIQTATGLHTLATVIDNIDAAIKTVSGQRAVLGASQNRFDAIISNLQVSSENQSAARSRIMDADFASETANLSRAQILQQAGNAMVAQANQLPQQVLSLLR